MCPGRFRSLFGQTARPDAQKENPANQTDHGVLMGDTGPLKIREKPYRNFSATNLTQNPTQSVLDLDSLANELRGILTKEQVAELVAALRY